MEGETFEMDPIPPEKAYGLLPQTGDIISVSDPSSQTEMNLEFIDIIENAPLPAEYAGYGFANPTTLYVLKDISHYIDEITTVYPTWENASVVTAMNDTMIWKYTTPPDDLMENFTWIEIPDAYTYITYWNSASSVSSINDSTIVITHTPNLGATMEIQSLTSMGSITTEYTVVEVTDDKINTSYLIDPNDPVNISYYEFDRDITLERNQTELIVFSYPTEGIEYILDVLKQIDPTINYSLENLAGETLLYEVEIVKVYKTSQES